MSDKILPKRSYTSGAVPTTSDLVENELAINWADSKAFTRNSAGNIVSVPLGGISWASVPASATASGTAGQVAYDGTYLYVCTATNVWRQSALSSWSADAYASLVSLLLHFDGNLTDSSGTPKTVTAVNGVSANGTAKYGSASMSLDGSGYLSIPYSSDLDLSGGDWTVEAWCKLQTVSRRVLFAINNGVNYVAAVLVMVNDDGSVYFLCESSGGSWIGNPSNNVTSAGAFTANTWHHVAAVRSGTTYTLYIDGTSAVSYTDSATMSNRNATSYIGYRQADGGGIWNGTVDEVRITKMARYTSTFTPPTAAFPNP